jgi:hypothetical protein
MRRDVTAERHRCQPFAGIPGDDPDFQAPTSGTYGAGRPRSGSIGPAAQTGRQASATARAAGRQPQLAAS